MTACSPTNTLMEENLKLYVHSNQVPTNKEHYQRLVGRLMYLVYTQPDLAYALSVVSHLYLTLLKVISKKGNFIHKRRQLGY
jgi:hypothetical protein